MSLGNCIEVDVTLSGISGSVLTPLSIDNSATITMTGVSASVSTITGDRTACITFDAGQDFSSSAPQIVGTSSSFSCNDLSICDLFVSGDLTGAGTVIVSGSGERVIISGSPSAAAIDIKDEGILLTSSPSSIDFEGDGVTASKAGNDITVSVPIMDTGNFVDFRETGEFITGAENIGTGSGIYSGKYDATFFLRSLSGISGVEITGAGVHTIIISGQTGDFVDKRETGAFVDRRETGVFVTGAENIGTGSGIYSGKRDATLFLRSIVGTGNVYVTGADGDDQIIYISGSGGGGAGEGTVTGASNIGAGSGIYSGTIDNDLKLKSLSGISGVKITGSGDQTIVVSGQTGDFVDKRETGVFVDRRETGVFVTGAENVGTGSGIYSGKHDATLSLRSLSGVSGVQITGAGDHTVIVSGQTGDFVDKRETGILVTGASNIGTGSGIYSGKLNADLKFRTLVGSGNVVVSGDERHIYITGEKPQPISVYDETSLVEDRVTSFDFIGPGIQANSPSEGKVNIEVPGMVILAAEGGRGTGAGFHAYAYHSNIHGHGNATGIAQEYNVLPCNQKTFDIRNDYNISTYKFIPTISGTYLLEASARLQNLDQGKYLELVLSGTHTERFTVPSEGRLAKGHHHATLVGYTQNIQTDCSVIVDTPGTGEFYQALFYHDNSIDKELIGEPDATFFNAHLWADPSPISGVHNIGLGTGLASGITEGIIQFRTIEGAGRVFVTGEPNSQTIYISGSGFGEENRAENIGWGSGIFSGKRGEILSFRRISGVSGIQITGTGGHTVIVSGQTGDFVDKRETGIFITGASNIGTGSGVYSGTIDNDLKLRSFLGTGNIFITGGIGGDDQHIYISGSGGGGGGEGTITGASNIGSGSGLYSGTLDNDLKFRSLVGTGNIQITGGIGEDDQHIYIGINVTGTIACAENLGSGIALFSGVSKPTESNSPGAPYDIHYDNVSLLIQSDHSDGSTSITDTSHFHHSVSVLGSTHHENTKKKWGSTSIYFDGVGAYSNGDRTSVADHPSLRFGLEEYTIECWFFIEEFNQAGNYAVGLGGRHEYWNGLMANMSSVPSGPTVYNGWSLCFNHYGQLGYFAADQGTAQVSSSVATIYTADGYLQQGRWYHVAVTRNPAAGSTMTTKMFLDGSLVGYYNDAIDHNDANATVLGEVYSTHPNASSALTYALKGYIEDARITKGVSRYNGTFSRPSATFEPRRFAEPGSSPDIVECIEFKTLSGVSGCHVVSDLEHVYISGCGGGDVTFVDPPYWKNDTGVKGQIAFDDNYFYICITGHGTPDEQAEGVTGEWRRMAMSTWPGG